MLNAQKTYSAKQSDIQRKWYIVSAKDKVLGRLATKIACVLRGKENPQFTPHVDSGDFVIVTDMEKIRLTGDKWNQKHYHRHSHHVGGLKIETAKTVRGKQPRRMMMEAVKGMLPKNKLGSALLKKLKVYVGERHPHAAQNPIELKVKA